MRRSVPRRKRLALKHRGVEGRIACLNDAPKDYTREVIALVNRVRDRHFTEVREDPLEVPKGQLGLGI